MFNPNTTDNAFVEPNPHRNYLYNWNLTIQRTIVSDWSATVAYVGSRGIHNGFTMDDANIVLPVALTPPYAWPTPRGSGTKVDPNAGVLRSGTWDGDSYYHALQVQGLKRMSHGFQLQTSYTWSKCVDTGSAISREDQFLNGISLFFFDKTLRRGLCDFNIYHSFVSNGIWNVPSPNLGAIGSAILGGWQLGTILTASSGVPFTVTIGGDPLGVNSSDPIAFPNRVAGPGCSHPVNAGNINYLNLKCFALPTAPASFTGPCQPFPASPNTCTNVLGTRRRAYR